jgi:hypothetical protein
MLDPVVNFFTRVFQAIGRGIGLFVAALAWPFVAAGRWYAGRPWIFKGPVGLVLLAIVALYGYFVWNTQVWSNFNTEYMAAYNFAAAGPATAGGSSGGEQAAGGEGEVRRTPGSRR